MDPQQAAAAGLAVGSGTGALVKGVLTSYLGDAIDTDKWIDGALPGAPIRVTVEHASGYASASGERVGIPEGALSGAEDPHREVRDHFLAHRAVDAGIMTLRLGLAGRRNQVVRITAIRPVAIERTEALAGSLLTEQGLGGAGEAEALEFDMDSPDPEAMRTDWETGEPAGRYFDSRTIPVSAGEGL